MSREDYRQIRLSVASMMQPFHGCDPEFIADVCHGKCCDAPTRPTGTLITIHRSEQAAIEARGGTVTNGLLESPDRVCPFKTSDHLCGLHVTPDKPFGCIVSPFTLNGRDCLIVRNRYRLLPCYKTETHEPAFRAFQASLRRLFPDDWPDITKRLERAYAANPGVRPPMALAYMRPDIYRMLHDNDETKKISA
jgi:hypothetical protein